MEIQIAANAKINLTLHITGRLPDGYHTLDTVMQSVGLSDIVTIRTLPAPGVVVDCSLEELAGEGNLVYRAATDFLGAIGNPDVGVEIYVEKHIPLAAGLGGGSADAAAVLVGLNRLMGEPLSLEQLQQLALPLGADVPFCLVGGTCIAKGKGEQLQSVSRVVDAYAVLVKPCEKESTAAMYKKYDEIKGLQQQKICDIISFKESVDNEFIHLALQNDFLPLYDQPDVANAINLLGEMGADGAMLSGSGPTVFGVFFDQALARQCAKRLIEQYVSVHTAPFVQEGWQILSIKE